VVPSYGREHATHSRSFEGEKRGIPKGSQRIGEPDYVKISLGTRRSGVLYSFCLVNKLTFIQTSANAMLEETKGMILKRDNENSRLREQRDQLNAELNERKNKDSVRWHSIQEYQKLVDQQAVCMQDTLRNE